ncbi:MAG: radical SAM protein [Calditrichaeota bacterium]|nr:MAG: radical SAM protein [Calditrichota bacterium]
MDVIKTEVHAEKGLRTMHLEANEAGLYSKKFMVEATSLCNLKCPLCPVPAHLHRDVGHMEMHTFREVIDDLVGHAKKIDFWNFGEPFLNPNFFEMVKYATDRGIKIRVSTNSTFLDDEYIEKIFWSNLSSIIVCLDGASKETHERYRIGSQFEKVRDGIRRLSLTRRKLGRELPFIRLQYLVFSYNEHEIEDIIEMAEEMQVDQLALKNVSLGTWIDGSIRKKIARKLLPKNDKYRKYTVSEDDLELKIEDSVCSWAYENGVVLSNGDVTTCCYDSSGVHAFANVHKDGGLLKILQSDKMKTVREQIKKRELTLCKTCQYSDYGATLVNFNYNGNGKTNGKNGKK